MVWYGMVWLNGLIINQRLIINQLITRCTRRLVLRRLGASAGAAARPRRARALGAAAAAAAPAALCCASASANVPARSPCMSRRERPVIHMPSFLQHPSVSLLVALARVL